MLQAATHDFNDYSARTGFGERWVCANFATRSATVLAFPPSNRHFRQRKTTPSIPLRRGENRCILRT